MEKTALVTETGLDNFKMFIKFLAKNDLLDEAVEHLKMKGHEKIIVSIEPITDIQIFIKSKFDLEKRKDAKRIVASAHQNCKINYKDNETEALDTSPQKNHLELIAA